MEIKRDFEEPRVDLGDRRVVKGTFSISVGLLK